jgi:hypothetical protein
MALKAGRNSYSGSMAELMEKIFKEQLANGQPKSSEQMKVLFIAVAEGVVRHLVEHPEAFVVTVNHDNDNRHITSVKIRSTDSP